MAKTRVATDQLMQPIAQFSLAQRVGDVIYVGATAGTDRRRELAGYGPGRIDAAEQTAVMLRNMSAALELLGGSTADVVRFKSYLNDWRDYGGYCLALNSHFGAGPPSRMTVGSRGFPLPQAVVEADLVAVVGGGRRLGRLDDSTEPAVPGGEAILAAGQLYCTATPSGRPGEMLGRDAAAQTEQALRGLAGVLARGGMTLGEAVMLTVTLADIRDYPEFESVYRRFFSPPYPARTVVGAPLGTPDLRIALECVAHPGGGRPLQGLGALAVQGAASPGMLAGEVLYVGGQPGAGRDGRLPGGIEAQTAAAWRRIEALVLEAGMALDDVVCTTNVLTDWRHYGGFNSGFARFVAAPYPPRTTLSTLLPERSALVQIEALAHREGRNARVIEVAGSGAAPAEEGR